MNKPIYNKFKKLVTLELLAYLCGKHKAEQEILPINKGHRYEFAA